MTTSATLTLDFHSITILAEFDFYCDDLSVDISVLTVVVGGVEVDEITDYVNDDAIEEIKATIVADYLERHPCGRPFMWRNG